MEQPITIRYRWTVDEFLQGYHYNTRLTCRPIFRLGLHFLFGLSLAGGIASMIFGGPAGKAPLGISVVFILAGVYWFAIYPFERRWMLRRKFAKHPEKDVEIEWQITTDKLVSRSVLWNSEFSWQMLTMVACAPTGIMLYPSDEISYFIPRHGFAGDAEFQSLAELAKSKVKRFYHVV
jgi:hypothetical protein